MLGVDIYIDGIQGVVPDRYSLTAGAVQQAAHGHGEVRPADGFTNGRKGLLHIGGKEEIAQNGFQLRGGDGVATRGKGGEIGMGGLFGQGDQGLAQLIGGQGILRPEHTAVIHHQEGGVERQLGGVNGGVGHILGQDMVLRCHGIAGFINPALKMQTGERHRNRLGGVAGRNGLLSVDFAVQDICGLIGYIGAGSGVLRQIRLTADQKTGCQQHHQ